MKTLWPCRHLGGPLDLLQLGLFVGGMEPFMVILEIHSCFILNDVLQCVINLCFNYFNSSKPVAEAVCEARLLAMLRGQQSCHTQTAEAEIFVFVRNMRSTAYRRALATIVLEQQNDDLGFM